MVLWFTGLSGSGKSTVAGALEEALHERGVSTYLLDGDNVRHGLCSDTGFSDEDRKENIRRVGKWRADGRCRAGGIDGIYISAPCGTADGARAPREGRFIEVFVDTPLAICEARIRKDCIRKRGQGNYAISPV